MNPTKRCRAAVVLLLSWAIASCRPEIQTRSEGMYSHDVDALARLIRLPTLPKSATWQTAKIKESAALAPGPEDWGLVAVLEFGESEMRALVPEHSTGTSSPPYLPSRFVFDWFPAELETHVKPAGDPDAVRIDLAAWSADAFAKPPLTHGFAARIDDTAYVLVYLQTM